MDTLTCKAISAANDDFAPPAVAPSPTRPHRRGIESLRRAPAFMALKYQMTAVPTLLRHLQQVAPMLMETANTAT